MKKPNFYLKLIVPLLIFLVSVPITVTSMFNQSNPLDFDLDDSSMEWVQTNGPYGGIIHTIEINPNQTNVLYAGGAGGVFKSIDSGVTWSNMPRFLEGNVRVEEIIMSPDNPLILYIRTESPTYEPGAEIFRSLDGGLSWSNIGQGKKFEALALNNDNPTDVIGCREPMKYYFQTLEGIAGQISQVIFHLSHSLM